jgi:hypothetical protein
VILVIYLKDGYSQMLILNGGCFAIVRNLFSATNVMKMEAEMAVSLSSACGKQYSSTPVNGVCMVVKQNYKRS